MRSNLSSQHRFMAFAATAFIAMMSVPQVKPANAAARQAGAVTNARIERDIVYSTNGGVDLKLDLYFPKAKLDASAPVAVYIHGGGWRNGNKSSGAWINEVTTELLNRGYIVAAIDYRLAPQAVWPAYIHDCKAAVRFLRANSTKYNLDPNRIGTWGSSAGGHLVALLGTTDATAKLEGEGGWSKETSRVQAVVDLFGPADLTKMMAGRVSEVFGNADALKQASPITHITKDDPPFLILQGDADKTVPPEQSQILYDQLKAAGVDAKLVMVKNGTHGLTGPNITPTKPELVKMIADFFDEHLKPH